LTKAVDGFSLTYCGHWRKIGKHPYKMIVKALIAKMACIVVLFNNK